MTTHFTHYPAPPGMPASPDYTLRINGEEVFVYHCPVASVASVDADTAVRVEIRPAFPFERVRVRPLSRGIVPEVGEGVIRFSAPPGTLGAPTLLSIELDDELRRPLFLFVNPPEEDPPQPGQDGVLYLEGGRVHDLGRIELQSGQTLYLAGGAVLRGNIVAREAKNIAIHGRGIIDGSLHTYQTAHRERLVHLIACDEVTVEGVLLLDGRTWQVMPAGCEDVTIRNVKIVSGSDSDDGIDLVGCRRALVDGCFIRTKDDCIAIKGFANYHERGGLPVRDIEVRNSVFWNAEWGNALEIGYETRVDSISHVRFHNCDVIRCEAERYGSGGVLTIHNGDRATVSDVLYEDIRVEEAREKLFDWKVCFDRYSRDAERGRIQGVTARNVRVVDGPAPVSILQGYDQDHLLREITFEDVLIHGRPLRGATEGRMVTEKVRDVRFVVDGLEYGLE